MFSQEIVEDIRERMRVETGLVVVGSADDQLRVGKTKKLMEGVTQSMIDRCILVSTKEKLQLFLCELKIFFPSLFHSCPPRMIMRKISLLFYWSLILGWTDFFYKFKKWQIRCNCPVSSMFYDVVWKLAYTGGLRFCVPNICTYLDSTHIFISNAKT